MQTASSSAAHAAEGGVRHNRPAVRPPSTNVRLRLYAIVTTLVLGSSALVVRAIDLQIVRKDFYQDQGDQRFLRDKPIPVSRGMITDRHGEPLAISTPVESIWANPQELLAHPERLDELARALEIAAPQLRARLTERAQREFVYLRRHLPPEQAQRILDLRIPGVSAQREFRRYYPTGEMTAHVLGFTNVDDRGQEGLELTFDDWLSGSAGLKRVLQDRRGRVVENVELLREPKPGHDLRLSIDKRIQYIAYRELNAALVAHQASSGSMVVMDIPTGEILAMVNGPSYNPNARNAGENAARRNRAVTDVFEPGSVIKALTVAAALESGKFDENTVIETAPGYLPVSYHVIRDVHNYGAVTLTRLLTKSSNVAAAKISLQLSNEHLYDMFHRFGFGQPTASGFPGESAGVLPPARSWGTLEKATLSYGYGLSVTALQLAAAYGALANHGRLRTPSFLVGGDTRDAAVLDPHIAQQVLLMLETVTGPEGTGIKAGIPNYRVAGKTGTSRKSVPGGYQKRYISVFAGMVPVSNPRLVGVVVINDPAGGAYYGGLVAAPVFGQVMTDTLRLLDIPPDNLAPLKDAGTLAQAAPQMVADPGAAVEDAFAEGVPQ